MEYLFELVPTKKLATLSHEELIHYVQYHSATISHLRRQLNELQKETEKLRQELGYGQTCKLPFDRGAEK